MEKLISSIADPVLSFFGRLREAASDKLNDESGVGVIEVILILLVLVGLVIIFKDQITSLARSIFSNITTQAGGV